MTVRRINIVCIQENKWVGEKSREIKHIRYKLWYKLWRAVPHCVLWCIWREQNSRCFEGKEQSISELKSLFFHILLEWSSSFNLFPCSNFLEMLDHCYLSV